MYATSKNSEKHFTKRNRKSEYNLERRDNKTGRPKAFQSELEGKNKNKIKRKQRPSWWEEITLWCEYEVKKLTLSLNS